MVCTGITFFLDLISRIAEKVPVTEVFRPNLSTLLLGTLFEHSQGDSGTAKSERRSWVPQSILAAIVTRWRQRRYRLSHCAAGQNLSPRSRRVI